MATFQMSDYYISLHIDELFASNGYNPPEGADRAEAVKWIKNFIIDSLSAELGSLMEYASVPLKPIGDS